MAVLTYAQIQQNVLDVLQADVSVDVPITTGAGSQMERAMNRALSSMWEISGGGKKNVSSATAWSVAQTADTSGKLIGILTDIKEVLRVWTTATSGSTGAAGDNELTKAELSELEFLRSNPGVGTYPAPKMYALTRMATATNADVNKFAIDFWPGIAGLYLPIQYIPQFTPIDAVTVTTPDVNDIQSHDLVYMIAIDYCDLNGRAEFAPKYAAQISEKTQQVLDRRYSAISDASQDR